MAPHGEALVSSSSMARSKNLINKPPKLSTDQSSLKRTTSDISFQLMINKEPAVDDANNEELPPISEVEDARCECCGMTEECTPEYVDRVREKYSGKYVCGLCGEAVKEELEKNGGRRDEALNAHMSACVRFNKFGRAFPVLHQAQAMREILKKNTSLRAKSISPRDKSGQKTGGIARSSSCIPAITRQMNDLNILN